MVAKTDYAGPTRLDFPSDNVIETPNIRLDMDPAALCVTVKTTEKGG